MKITALFRHFTLPLGLAVATASLANGTDYYKAAPFKPMKVIKVFVDKPSEKSRLDMKEDCSTFVITSDQVRKFFDNARSISEHQRMHEFDWSACYAEGKLHFANQETGSWTIARHGTGALTFDKGRRKGKTIYLHCAKCEEWPF